MYESDILEKLGLRQEEAKVYMILLSYGQISVRKIAAYADLNRGAVYEAIKSLTARGLVNFHRKGERKYYFAESPEKLRGILRDRKLQLISTEASLNKILPQLAATAYGNKNQNPIARFYEDDDGIRLILKDVISTSLQLKPRQYLVYSSRPNRHYLYRRFPNYTQERIRNGIFVKVLAIGEGGEEVELSERKWLPEPKEGQKSSYTIVYGNKIAMIGISDEEVPYGVVIDDPSAAGMQRLLFDHLWKQL